MKCQKCGKEVRAGAKFCDNCGAAIVVSDVCPVHQNVVYAPPKAKKKLTSRPIFWIPVAAVGLFFALVVVGALLADRGLTLATLTNRQTESPANTPTVNPTVSPTVNPTSSNVLSGTTWHGALTYEGVSTDGNVLAFNESREFFYHSPLSDNGTLLIQGGEYEILEGVLLLRYLWSAVYNYISNEIVEMAAIPAGDVVIHAFVDRDSINISFAENMEFDYRKGQHTELWNFGASAVIVTALASNPPFAPSIGPSTEVFAANNDWTNTTSGNVAGGIHQASGLTIVSFPPDPRIACSMCDGTRRTTCHQCNGTGTSNANHNANLYSGFGLQGLANMFNTMPCGLCQGSREVDCLMGFCDGSQINPAYWQYCFQLKQLADQTGKRIFALEDNQVSPFVGIRFCNMCDGKGRIAALQVHQTHLPICMQCFGEGVRITFYDTFSDAALYGDTNIIYDANVYDILNPGNMGNFSVGSTCIESGCNRVTSGFLPRCSQHIDFEGQAIELGYGTFCKDDYCSNRSYGMFFCDTCGGRR